MTIWWHKKSIPISKTKNFSIQINLHRTLNKLWRYLIEESSTSRHTGNFQKDIKREKNTRNIPRLSCFHQKRKIFANPDSSRGRYFPTGCSSPWVTVCFEIGIDSQASYILSSSKGYSFNLLERSRRGRVSFGILFYTCLVFEYRR